MLMSVIETPVNTPSAWSERARAFAASWEACGWSQVGQADRHRAIVAALDPQPGESLLDWGCGTGELAALLPDTVGYVGFDTAVGMVARARREHPGLRFVTREPYGRFDVVACVGPFNLPGGWSKQHTWHTLRHLWEATGCRALAVSLYAGHDANCLSYDRGEAFKHARALSYRVEAIESRANDLLLLVSR